MDVASSAEVVGGGFGLMEVLVLADLFNTLGEHERAINVIRKGCRWLQGRAEQVYWDACDDDREYDLPETGPRPGVGEDGSVEPGRFPLDINARHRLAVARIKMGEIEEGKVWLLPPSVTSITSYFVLASCKCSTFTRRP